MSINTERIFANLFSLLSQTQNLNSAGQPDGTPAFVTTSRRTLQVSAVNPALQPAMFLMQGPQEFVETTTTIKIALPKQELTAGAIVYFRTTGALAEVPSTVLNHLRDALFFQMYERTLANDFSTVIPLLGGKPQTLGGVCYYARFIGKVGVQEGLQNQQGGLIFPISILSGF